MTQPIECKFWEAMKALEEGLKVERQMSTISSNGPWIEYKMSFGELRSVENPADFPRFFSPTPTRGVRWRYYPLPKKVWKDCKAWEAIKAFQEGSASTRYGLDNVQRQVVGMCPDWENPLLYKWQIEVEE